MNEYIKLFSTNTERTEFENSEDYIEDYVSLVEEDDSVHYNKIIDYSQLYLTTEALEDGTISFNIWSSMGTNYITSISYSTDNGSTWTTTNNTDNKESNLQITVNVSSGDKILWKGSAIQLGFYDDDEYGDYVGSFFSSDCEFNVQGNVMSMMYGDNFVTHATALDKDAQLAYLFSDYDGNVECKVVSAENLILPSTTLESNCYYSMFQNCTSLTTAPELPATTLAKNCYDSMFYGCTSLTIAPELPATTLAIRCYRVMFYGCTSLNAAPELPATTLADMCYYGMFNGTNVLPDCSNIDFTSETVVLSGGLQGLFAGTKVTDSDLMNILPINPSTNKYYLPATTLAERCYNSMFQGCTSLTTAPELPATTLATRCYSSMFEGCTNLNNITCLATDISAYSCTTFWLYNVASSGTFTKAASMTSWETGTYGVPSGWEVQTASE